MKNTLFVLFLMLSTTLFGQTIIINSKNESTFEVSNNNQLKFIEEHELIHKYVIDFDKKMVKSFFGNSPDFLINADGVLPFEGKNQTLEFNNDKFSNFTIEVFYPQFDKTLTITLSKLPVSNEFVLCTSWNNDNLVFFKNNVTVNFE
jgi:hypothetical protein